MSALRKYGLDKELAAREEAKRDPAIEAQVVRLLEELSGETVGADLLESLKSGEILCKALNTVVPGAVRINENTKMPFKQMENITNFIRGCRENLHMKEFELFTTADLYDGKSVLNVTNALVAFSRAAQRYGYNGFVIGPKEAVPEATKHWELGENAEVSKLSLGSSQTMQTDKVHDSTGPAWKTQGQGQGQCESCGCASGVSKLSLGSSQTMEKAQVVDTVAPTWKATRGSAKVEESRRRLDGDGIATERKEGKEEVIPGKEERALKDVLQRLSERELDGDLLEVLKDGVVLCTALNKMIPGAVPKVSSSKIPFKQRENLGNFMRACKAHEVLKEYEMFETSDLYDRKGVHKVVTALQAFCSFAEKQGQSQAQQ